MQESVADGKRAKVPRILPQDVTFLNAISAKPARDWIVAREAEMDEAINEWTCFILTWPNCCEVAEQLSQLQRNMIADVLGSKTPGTLRKRLRALKGYDKVLREYYGDAFPTNEQVLYDFLKHLQRQDLQQSILEAQAEVNKTTQEYETKVLTQCAEEAHHGVESVLQALGIQEDALTEATAQSCCP